MNIHGIGIDMVEISRIEKIFLRYGDLLAKRILTQKEWKEYKNNKQQVRFLSKHFAVKEATSKAFGIGMNYGLNFCQFELFHDKLGKPMLRLFNKAAYLANKLSISCIHVSLTDERYYAYAIVLFEKN